MKIISNPDCLVHKVLLEHSYACPLMCCLWLLLCDSHEVEWLYGPQSLRCLLSGSLQKTGSCTRRS